MKTTSHKKCIVCALLIFFSCMLCGGNIYTSFNHTSATRSSNSFPEPSVKFEWSNYTIHNGDDVGYDIVIDSEGFIYIAGKEYNNTKGAYDVIIAKYDNSSNQLWKRYWGGTSNDIGSSIDIDSSDNIYIVGRTETYGVGDYDVCVIKYNKFGHFKWNRTWGGSEFDAGYGVAIDNGDNVYVTGYTESYSTFGDILLLKYNKTGHLKFNSMWGGVDTDLAYDLTITLFGDIYITGYTSSFGAITSDLLLVKYNSSLEVDFYTTWGGPLQDEGRSIVSDSEGNIYIASNTKNYGAGGTDMTLLKFNATDELEYNETWGGSENDFAYGIGRDLLNNTYVVGATESRGDIDGDICVVKFNYTGGFQWYKTDGDMLADVGYGIVLDTLDNIYITGTIENSGTGKDLYLVKFSQLPDNFVIMSDTGSIDSDGNFTLSWQPSLDADNYSLYQYHMPIVEYNSSLIELVAGNTNRTYKIQNLGQNSYYFMTIAFNIYEGNTSSNCLKITVLFPPEDFYLADNEETPDTDGMVNLTWTPSQGAKNYSVYSHTSYIHEITNNGTLIINGLTNQSYLIEGLTNGEVYYAIVAKNDAGQKISNCSEIIVRRKPDTFNLYSDADVPDPDGSFDLIWSKSEYSDNYSVYFSTSFIEKVDHTIQSIYNYTPEFDWSTFRYSITGRISGVFYYRVVAFNEYGNSSSECLEISVQLPEHSFSSSSKNKEEARFVLTSIMVQLILFLSLLMGLGVFIVLRKILIRR